MQHEAVETAQDLLARLVAFDTTSHRSNMPLISFVRDYLADHGVESQLIATPDGEKANLFATLGSMADAVPDADGRVGIGLSGHTDVVPVTGQAWDTDPFTLTEKDGKLYGRGTCDMKGFIACALAAVPALKARTLKTPVHLLLSYDEEVGCTGVRPMIEQFGSTLPTPQMVIVGEPTTMEVVDGHKGATRLRVEVTGRAAHSSMAHLGANAVMAAARMIAEAHACHRACVEGPQYDRFTPPHPTVQVNLVEGGFAQNVVPVTSVFAVDIRVLPGRDTVGEVRARLQRFADEVILPELRAVAPEANVSIEETNSIPPFLAGEASQATTMALKLAGTNDISAVSYGTEAGLFQEGGAPSIVCGPGDIAQAHTANEFLVKDELGKCMAFMDRLGDQVAA
ncbi:MAG: acetylornithine deacetylase [Pseudomonadota bacterium]